MLQEVTIGIWYVNDCRDEVISMILQFKMSYDPPMTKLLSESCVILIK
jgi:hypothetical protein